MKYLSILFLLAAGCTTTTTTAPDGTIVTVRTTDAKTIKLLSDVATRAVASGVDAAIQIQGAKK